LDLEEIDGVSDPLRHHTTQTITLGEGGGRVVVVVVVVVVEGGEGEETVRVIIGGGSGRMSSGDSDSISKEVSRY